ncbi:MAG: hypothetical protein KZQ65_08485, partial [Candidatus Thiodiazotropha sp. (ex Gloverina cf. vestifex)]|nr:hypothetical protein [Candidatus Thiodiazotropha sp. (ex Gloverina cf. vestifex)]
ALFFFAHGSFEASERKRSLTNDSFRASLTVTITAIQPRLRLSGTNRLGFQPSMAISGRYPGRRYIWMQSVPAEQPADPTRKVWIR